jgi:hypothetical protein
LGKIKLNAKLMTTFGIEKAPITPQSLKAASVE